MSANVSRVDLPSPSLARSGSYDGFESLQVDENLHSTKPTPTSQKLAAIAPSTLSGKDSLPAAAAPSEPRVVKPLGESNRDIQIVVEKVPGPAASPAGSSVPPSKAPVPEKAPAPASVPPSAVPSADPKVSSSVPPAAASIPSGPSPAAVGPSPAPSAAGKASKIDYSKTTDPNESDTMQMQLVSLLGQIKSKATAGSVAINPDDISIETQLTTEPGSALPRAEQWIPKDSSEICYKFKCQYKIIGNDANNNEIEVMIERDIFTTSNDPNRAAMMADDYAKMVSEIALSIQFEGRTSALSNPISSSRADHDKLLGYKYFTVDFKKDSSGSIQLEGLTPVEDKSVKFNFKADSEEKKFYLSDLSGKKFIVSDQPLPPQFGMEGVSYRSKRDWLNNVPLKVARKGFKEINGTKVNFLEQIKKEKETIQQFQQKFEQMQASLKVDLLKKVILEQKAIKENRFKEDVVSEEARHFYTAQHLYQQQVSKWKELAKQIEKSKRVLETIGSKDESGLKEIVKKYNLKVKDVNLANVEAALKLRMTKLDEKLKKVTATLSNKEHKEKLAKINQNYYSRCHSFTTQMRDMVAVYRALQEKENELISLRTEMTGSPDAGVAIAEVSDCLKAIDAKKAQYQKYIAQLEPEHQALFA